MSEKQRYLINEHLNKYCINNTIHIDLLTDHKKFGFKTYPKFKSIIDQYNLNIIYYETLSRDYSYFGSIRRLNNISYS